MITTGGAKSIMTKILKATKDIEKNKKKEVPAAVKWVAAQILKDAKKMCPVRTGALRRSGRIEVEKETGSEAIVTVAFGGRGAGVDYAPFVEFGRQSHAPMSPRPYLRPAIRKNRDNLRRIGEVAYSKSWR